MLKINMNSQIFYYNFKFLFISNQRVKIENHYNSNYLIILISIFHIDLFIFYIKLKS